MSLPGHYQSWLCDQASVLQSPKLDFSTTIAHQSCECVHFCLFLGTWNHLQLKNVWWQVWLLWNECRSVHKNGCSRRRAECKVCSTWALRWAHVALYPVFVSLLWRCFRSEFTSIMYIFWGTTKTITATSLFTQTNCEFWICFVFNLPFKTNKLISLSKDNEEWTNLWI